MTVEELEKTVQDLQKQVKTLKEQTTVLQDIEEHGLDVISDVLSGHFAWFRGLELAFAINRLRGLDVIQQQKKCDH